MSEILLDLKPHSILPLLVGGNFHKIFYHSEQKGGPCKSQSLIDNFRSSFINIGLYDPGYLGYDLTWCNFHENGNVVEERLDHFCEDRDWSLMFPDAFAIHLDSTCHVESPTYPAQMLLPQCRLRSPKKAFPL